MLTTRKTIKCYSELIALPAFEQRFNYLKLSGNVGDITFGYERYLNQSFYRSTEWKRIRRQVIIRDNSCDLAIPGRDLYDHVVIHHLNPITTEDVEENSIYLLDPEYLITTCEATHNAIHYSDSSILMLDPVIRKPGDTKLW